MSLSVISEGRGNVLVIYQKVKPQHAQKGSEDSGTSPCIFTLNSSLKLHSESKTASSLCFLRGDAVTSSTLFLTGKFFKVATEVEPGLS